VAQSQVQAAQQAAQAQADEQATRAQQQAAPATQPVTVIAPPPPPNPGIPSAAVTAGGSRTGDDSAQRQLRQSLLAQLGGTLQARDTPKGLVVTIPDADFHGAALNTFVNGPLARVASVIAAQPALTVEVDGHSDTAAAEGAQLAEARAEAVRTELVRGGLSGVTARGLGSATPIGPNTSAQGRESNRRVEIVVSGNAIGSMASWDRAYTIK
jgi:flagellar motor protein MotB